MPANNNIAKVRNSFILTVVLLVLGAVLLMAFDNSEKYKTFLLPQPLRVVYVDELSEETTLKTPVDNNADEIKNEINGG